MYFTLCIEYDLGHSCHKCVTLLVPHRALLCKSFRARWMKSWKVILQTKSKRWVSIHTQPFFISWCDRETQRKKQYFYNFLLITPFCLCYTERPSILWVFFLLYLTSITLFVQTEMKSLIPADRLFFSWQSSDSKTVSARLDFRWRTILKGSLRQWLMTPGMLFRVSVLHYSLLLFSSLIVFVGLPSAQVIKAI